ncbi:MAG TPA: hypothetical protein VEG68_17730, partial [Terriglobales bacterium]|nr:hypothetical protein [Terriglobales bacterium]
MNASSAGLKMLMVHEDPEAVKLVSQALGEEKVELFTSSSGESALQQLSQVRPQIVLSNLLLPGMGG